MKQKYDEQVIEQENKPEINYELLYSKFQDLKKGIDNKDYLKDYIKKQKEKREFKEYLRNKYDYRNKKILKTNE